MDAGETDLEIPDLQGITREIQGYRRPDGKFGIRNHVLILPCSLCASETARFIAENVKGSTYLPNQGGCSLSSRDYEITMDTLSGVAANPNVYGTIIIGNGCEVIQAADLKKAIVEKTCKPVFQYIIREEGGSLKTVNKAVAKVEELVKEASLLKREQAHIRELVVGTECGGSDPTSGLVSNPIVGKVSDIVVALGGSSILSETPEMIGAENILAKRAKNKQLEEDILGMIGEFEQSFISVGMNPRSGNPTPGNIAGGITTLEEKSLGCIHKSGTAEVTEVIHYAKPIHEKGLIVMDTPGQDIASIAGMAAAGAQVVLFTTGHGTPTGFGVVPVIKITGNEQTAQKMKDHIDFDCSDILTGHSTIAQSGKNLFELTQKVCCGQRTKAEELGFNDMSIARYCNFA
ncbi:MAG: UxaA family hydrolase [Lachnospiraceae bacterium]|nr:UxaA family hydrolase [Lachnospiraceae bacterium]